MHLHSLVSGLGLVCLLSAIGATQAFAQERFAASADGQEITDSKTGLIWRRCAEGLAWKARTCAGQPVFTNQGDAAARARSAAAGATQWRLPTMKELSSLVLVRDAEEGKAVINAEAFPGTPVARFWTSSSVGPGYFMFVGFSEGSAGESARNSPGAIRLVRDAK